MALEKELTKATESVFRAFMSPSTDPLPRREMVSKARAEIAELLALAGFGGSGETKREVGLDEKGGGRHE